MAKKVHSNLVCDMEATKIAQSRPNQTKQRSSMKTSTKHGGRRKSLRTASDKCSSMNDNLHQKKEAPTSTKPLMAVISRVMAKSLDRTTSQRTFDSDTSSKVSVETVNTVNTRLSGLELHLENMMDKPGTRTSQYLQLQITQHSSISYELSGIEGEEPTSVDCLRPIGAPLGSSFTRSSTHRARPMSFDETSGVANTTKATILMASIHSFDKSSDANGVEAQGFFSNLQDIEEILSDSDEDSDDCDSFACDDYDDLSVTPVVTEADSIELPPVTRRKSSLKTINTGQVSQAIKTPVSFGSVVVRFYGCEVNPSRNTRGSSSTDIKWTYNEESTISVDEWEKQRKPSRRRGSRQLRENREDVPGPVGCSEEEVIVEVNQAAVNKSKHQRSTAAVTTIDTVGKQKLEEASSAESSTLAPACHLGKFCSAKLRARQVFIQRYQRRGSYATVD
jgi:hypothetical protein